MGEAVKAFLSEEYIVVRMFRFAVAGVDYHVRMLMTM
jgi:hypothetical protein